MLKKTFVGFCISFLMTAGITGQGLAASPQEDLVLQQIQFTKDRIAQHKAELKALYTQFAANPSPDVYAKTQVLSANIQKERGILSNLDLALRDARASSSWKAMLDDAAKESTVLSAAAVALSSVANAGQWIFGASHEDIFGDSWQNVENLNSNLSAEARKIIEESEAIRKALTEIQHKLDSGDAAPEIQAFQQELTERLSKLNARAELVKKNMRFMVRVYKAEKQNLPASTMFWGEYMGRYIEQVIANVDLAKLVDYAMSLADGDIISPLVDLVKPMIKTAMADHLAKMAGGSALTPKITDDLVFSILFGSESGFQALVINKTKDAAAQKAIEGTIQGVVQGEAQVLIGKSDKLMYGYMKTELASLPANAPVNEREVIQNFWEKRAQADSGAIRASAQQKLDKMKKTGDIVKKVWDLVLKDVVQAWMNADTFKNAVKSANEACQGWRKYYKENQDDMIDTEDEYVNAKWFSGGRTMAAGTPPPKAADSVVQATREVYEDRRPDEVITFVEDYKEDLKSEEAQKAGMSISEVQGMEQKIFDMVLSGKMPVSGLILPDAWALSNAKTSEPCTNLSKEQSKVYMAASDECQRIWHAKPFNSAAYSACQARVAAISKANTEALQACFENTVNAAYRSYAEFRAGLVKQLYKKIEQDHLDRLQIVKDDLGPALSWALRWETQAKELSGVLEKVASLPYFQGIAPLPDIPEKIPAGNEEPAYDDAKNKEAASALVQYQSLLKGVNREKIEEALGEADFTWEFPQFVWEERVRVYDEIKTGGDLRLGWKDICGYYSTVQCGKERLVEDPDLDRMIKSIYEANPEGVRSNLNSLDQNPAVAFLRKYPKATDFSIDKALSLYEAALGKKAAVVSRQTEVNKLLTELSQSAEVPKSVYDILYLYDVFFQPWQFLRGANPGLAAQRLMRDTEAFGKELKELEGKYQGQKQAAVQIDPAALEQAIAALKAAYKSYGQAFDDYYDYLAEYFTDRKIPEFTMPDLSGFEMQVYSARANQEETAIKFKKAAKALEEMKKALQEMEQADQEILNAANNRDGGRGAVVNALRQFWTDHKKDADLGPVLAALEKAKKDYYGAGGTGYGIPDHPLPEKVKKAMAGLGGDDSYKVIQQVEDEVNAEMEKRSQEKLFSDYRLTDPRVNSYDLRSAYGEVVLLPEQLREGKILLTGWLSHIDGIEKMLFSSDNGRTWREVPVQQAVQIEIAPMPGSKIEPKLRIKTKLMKEFELVFFPNITSIIYRDLNYSDMLKKTVIDMAGAYERQDATGFAAFISRDFIGNRVFLEEGVRFDFELFTDIRLKIYIDRVEKRGDMYVAETKWDKSQVPRKTGQEQKTTGRTTMMFVMEDGAMRIKNLRGNLLYATLSPEIAESSGQSSTVIDDIREAKNQRNPVQPGASETLDDGGVGTTGPATPPRTGTATMNDIPGHTGVQDGFDFSTGAVMDGSGAADIYLETNIFWTNGGAQIQASVQSYDALTEAPSGGYGNGPVDASTNGATHVFITQEGYYGKVQITGHTDDGFATTSTTFRYAVQTDGSRNLQT
ncbi:MAG: hypothetical protein ACOY3K_06820 [Candidatus Omnitrophota bacterium]